MNRKCFSVLFVIMSLTSILAACRGKQISESPLVTPPAISVEITGDECPSIEIQAGMQVAWTNRDNIDHLLILERMGEDGVLADSGGTDLLQPGTTFSITLTEPGQYTYYCSKDRTAFGTINVLP